jgi:mannitol operon transcriptional antiterminator
MGFSDREVSLIGILLRHPEGLTADGIASRLGVSTRTVHRDLQPAEEFLASHGLKLLKQAGRGVSVEGTSEKRQEALESLRSITSSDLSPQERQLSLLRSLLVADHPTKLRALASGLGVAVGTVSRDLDELEPWLSEFRLSLLRKRGYGVEIVGMENDRREAMSRVVFQSLDEGELLSRPKQYGEDDRTSSSGRGASRTAGQLMGMIDAGRLRRVEALTEDVVAGLPYSIADVAFVGLSVHVALMVERRLQNAGISLGAEILQRLSKTDEYDYARSLAASIEKEFGISVPEEEIGYLTMHLRGTKLREDDALRGYFETSDLQVASQVKALIRNVEEKTGIPLAGDSSLYTGLLAHLERAIYRLRENMRIHNPLLEDVKSDYPALFDLVSGAMQQVFIQENIPEEETGFVAMHFGAALDRGQGDFPRSVLVICSSGIATTKILASRLKNSFPQIQAIQNSSLFELEDTNLSDYDLVVSTVVLPIPNDSYVEVRPLLSDEEVELIRDHLREKSLKASLTNQAAFESLEIFGGGHAKFHQMAEATQLIAELVDDAYLARHEAHGSLNEAVRLMCASLASKGLVSEPRNLEESLFSRMELGGIGIPGTSLALFHARDAAATRPSFSVHDFDEALDLEGLDGAMMRVRRSLLMVAPLTLSPVALEAISEISVAMVEQPLEREVFENGSEARIVEVLQSIFARFLHNKLS